MSAGPPVRVVLVGFMGAGKSTVGAAVAGALGWRFVDVDDVVESEGGRPIGQIFDLFGESHFRQLEARAVERLLAEERVVISTGGGWAAQPGAFDRIPSGTATVWLDVGLDEAVRRARRTDVDRPLLRNAGPGATAGKEVTDLFVSRRPYYALAAWTVDTEGSSVEDVTARVLEILAANESETGIE